MPPKNKACKNAFFYFMMEFKDKQTKKFNNMQEVAHEAGQYWQNMNADERRPYEMKAKTNKNVQKVIKYNSSGQNVELVQKEQMEILKNEQLMKDDITDTIHFAVESDRRYYPAEIGIAKFNLRNGVTENNIFNIICKPGSLPLGYSALAKQVSESSHQIPPPISSDMDYNLEEVANSLWQFIMKTNNNKLPPVYATRKNQPVVQNVLFNLSADFGYDELKTYSLEYLFFVLRNNCSEERTWVASSLSELELEKDKYEFCLDIPCPYHVHSEVPNHCSQSHVIRSVFTICDNCCADLSIELIPGQHIPKKANTNPTPSNTRPSSSAPSESRYSYNQGYSGYLSRAESDYSAVSETSTVADVNDLATVTGLDSEYSQTDGDEWFPALPKSKGLSSSQSSAKQPLRRPNTLSAALTGPRGVGKGRGRGIAANFSANN